VNSTMPLGLTELAITKLPDGRRGNNARHTLGGLIRQSVFGRLAGYEDVNDAERLACDPAMRAIVGREGLHRAAASSSLMGRLETEWLATDANLAALMDLSGAWIDLLGDRDLPVPERLHVVGVGRAPPVALLHGPAGLELCMQGTRRLGSRPGSLDQQGSRMRPAILLIRPC
jgi:hypothetical protein